MKRDPHMARALAFAAEPQLPENFAVRLEQLAYSAALAMRPSACVEWGIAGLAVVCLGVATWIASRLDPDLIGALHGVSRFFWNQGAGAEAASSGLPALAIAALLWLGMPRAREINFDLTPGRA
jgi:hypothetical protein